MSLKKDEFFLSLRRNSKNVVATFWHRKQEVSSKSSKIPFAAEFGFIFKKRSSLIFFKDSEFFDVDSGGGFKSFAWIWSTHLDFYYFLSYFESNSKLTNFLHHTQVFGQTLCATNIVYCTSNHQHSYQHFSIYCVALWELLDNCKIKLYFPHISLKNR